MPYKILTTNRIPGHAEGVVVEASELTEFWEHQLLAGNAVVLSEPESKSLDVEKSKPRGKRKAPRTIHAVIDQLDDIDADPED